MSKALFKIRIAGKHHKPKISTRNRINNVYRNTNKCSTALLSALNFRTVFNLERYVKDCLFNPGLFIYNESYNSLSDSELSEVLAKFTELSNVESEVPSCIKWWQVFVESKKQEPRLIARVISEMQARDVNILTFFISYVYSESDNIASNFSYLDYKSALKRELISNKKDLVLVNLIKLLLSDLDRVYCKEIIRDRVLRCFYEKFCSYRHKWIKEDVIALAYLLQSGLILKDLFSLVVMSGSFLPSALLFYNEYLKCSDNEVWSDVRAITSSTSILSEIQQSCRKLYLLKESIFINSIGIPMEIIPIKFEEVKEALSKYPGELDNETIKQLMNFLLYKKVKSKQAMKNHIVRLRAVFKYCVSEDELANWLVSR